MAIRFKSGDADDLSAFEQQFETLPFDKQRELLISLQGLLQRSVEGRRRELEAELASLDALSGPSQKSRTVRPPVTVIPSRAKVDAKYRSKKDPNLVWSGRGLSPRWLKEEMNQSQEPKESFLIAVAASGS